MTTRTLLDLHDRVAGSLTGLLVGDALGVPYEFHSPSALPPAEQIEYTPPERFPRAHAGVAPGTWSDDGAQALVLLDSLLARDGLDIEHFARGLRRWAREGFCAVDGLVFDIGIQTGRALSLLDAGVAAGQAGPAGERDNGNGSLMRVLPVALWHQGSDEELAELAMRQSLPTHGHPRAQIACAMYCLWVRSAIAGCADAWDVAAMRLEALAPALQLPSDEIALVLDPANSQRTGGSGYVVDTLWSARAAVAGTTSFDGCVRQAIQFGHDTDTTAAVAGGIAGAMYGLSGIPAWWSASLRGSDILEPLLQTLLARHGASRATGHTGRTSASHPIRIAELPALAGAVGITFCPGKKQPAAMTGPWDRDLDLDLAAIKAWGASHIVTLVEQHELSSLAVEHLPERARALGIRWHHVPIVDQHIPDAQGEVALAELLPRLVSRLRNGERVLVHCKGGLGRAGTVAALLLLSSDEAADPAQVIERIRAVRPGAIETRSQQRYVEAFRARP